jgi:hypothetical protein
VDLGDLRYPTFVRSARVSQRLRVRLIGLKGMYAIHLPVLNQKFLTTVLPTNRPVTHRVALSRIALDSGVRRRGLLVRFDERSDELGYNS